MQIKTAKAKKKLNNEGFSLLELIVVIAIMLVLVALVFGTTSMLNSSYVNKTYRGIEDAMNHTRSKAMSVLAKEWNMVIYVNSDADFQCDVVKVTDETKEDGTVVTQKEVVRTFKMSEDKKIDIELENGDGVYKVDKSNKLYMTYDATTGKIKDITVGGATLDLSGGIGKLNIDCGGYTSTMKIYYNTGKTERQ